MTDYIRTYSKIKFYPVEPVLEDIRIEDIAHALSLMTRANGHFDYFYSVGQHSINCYKEATARGYDRNVRLGCLLHDGSEAYLSDITRPVKAQLPQYRIYEEILQTMIYERFGLALTPQDQIEIQSVDDALLYHEFIVLKDEKVFEEVPMIVLEHDFSLRDFGGVEREFLDIFNTQRSTL